MAGIQSACGANWQQSLDGVLDVPVTVSCAEPGAWRIAAVATAAGEATGEAAGEAGVAVVDITLTADKAARPPEFTVSWKMPERDMPYYWHVSTWLGSHPASWGWRTEKSWLCSRSPIYAYYSDDHENRLVVATDDARRRVTYSSGLREETCALECEWRFFAEPAPDSTNERIRLRFDRRRVRWSDAVRDGSDWIARSGGFTPMPVPASAFEPLYSAWYSFHQDVHAADIEAECAIAASLGMKTVIVDDGWQTDDTNRGYDYCGDWEMSAKRFPDMKAHVAKVHALGMKYMIWYSVPFVGIESKAAQRFKDMLLRQPKKGCAGLFDPRFPAVREYLIGLWTKAMRDWDLDGLKLDFIDAFIEAPWAKPGDGRDIAGVTEAVDRLMTDAAARIRAVKPDALIEFRQSYMGPAIRQYGNMMRVGDCPGNMAVNRSGIASLRLTSGNTAVHADMLEWRLDESAEDAARYILNTLFGTVQYSVMLRKAPEAHRAMIRHWIAFAHEHEDALQHGAFRPYGPHLNWCLLEGEGKSERVIGLYAPELVADAGDAKKTTYVLNAVRAQKVTVRLAASAEAESFDTFGHRVATRTLPPGVSDVACPPSGYVRLTSSK